ncbi:MAG: heparinase II/III family protein, partial [Clostridia bacterium]|nr:heparinase II/III family protein [Clostridia bacterium]
AFASGDDHTTDARFHDFGYIALLSSHLFGDATARALLEYGKKSYSDFGEYFTSGASAATYLICSSTGVKAANDRHEGMPLLLYNGGWLGQIIARNGWDQNQTAVLMKIGCRSAANHEHNDAGQFQIFYRTMLAGDTGSYDKYGDPHHYWYHQATVAHNSLLIYNPALAGEDRGYYSGGQTHKWEIHDFPTWKTDREHKTGTVTGMQYGYADRAETKPTYAYIAGEITPAYHEATVSLVTRRMLTVFDTKTPDVPLFFFVFDRITATDPSFKKTFLLHVPTEPVLDGNVVTVVSGEGKLVLQNLSGGDAITVIGGEGANYVVNGQQLAPCKNCNDGFFGRVELSPAPGNATDDLLNVLFVTDADCAPSLPATAVETASVRGAVIGRVAAIFVSDPARRDIAFDFVAPGDGTLDYYVSGVAAGDWTVTSDEKTQIATATDVGGLLVFTAPAGRIALAPPAKHD